LGQRLLDPLGPGMQQRDGLVVSRQEASTMVSTSSRTGGSGSQSSASTDQPTWTYPAFAISRSTRASLEPAPNGLRNQGLGSTPVIAMMFSSAVLMSQARPGLFSCGRRAW